MSILNRSHLFVRRFGQAQRGTTAMIFGLTIIPLLALAGGAVDYGFAIKTKSQLASTLDSAVLGAMLQYTLDDSTDYKKVVNDYVKKNLTEAQKSYLGEAVVVTVPDIGSDGELRAELSTTVTTNFLSFIGFGQFNIKVHSGAKVGGSKVEVMMVLDNTASMAGSKLDDLKSAAQSLVNTVAPNGDDPNVKFGLVPFADYVNIGMDNRNEPGLDIPADYDYTPSGTWSSWSCPNPSVNEHCSQQTPPGPCYNDGNVVPCQSQNVCTCDVPKVETQHPYSQQHWAWHGCMASRPHDLNVKDEDLNTLIPGVMMDWNMCGAIAPVTRLTSTLQTINDGIDAMKSERETYIPSGLIWGWRLLSNEAPFNDGAPYTDQAVSKILVLMTDGKNTKAMRKWEPSWNWGVAKHHTAEIWGHDRSWSNPEVQANQYTAELCTNIKQKGIIVYTIGFQIPAGSQIETLMKDCAGNKDGKYYDAANGTELAEAFEEIGKSLLNLRLSQ